MDINISFESWGPLATVIAALIGALVPLYREQRRAAKNAEMAATNAEEAATEAAVAATKADVAATEAAAANRNLARNHSENSAKLDRIADQTNGKLIEAQKRIEGLEHQLYDRTEEHPQDEPHS